MSLPTRTELQTLDVAADGGAWTGFAAKSGVDTSGLDFAADGGAFVGNPAAASGGGTTNKELAATVGTSASLTRPRSLLRSLVASLARTGTIARAGVNFTDAFTGSGSLEGHTTDQGHAWNRHFASGTAYAEIVSNAARAAASAASIYYASIPVASADYDVEVTVATNSGSEIGGGPVARIDPAAVTFYFAYWDGTQWIIAKYVAGAVGTPGVPYTGSSPFTAPRRVRLRVEGSWVHLFIDGVLRDSVNDGSITAAGYPGIAFVASTATYDNLRVFDPAATGTTTPKALTASALVAAATVTRARGLVRTAAASLATSASIARLLGRRVTAAASTATAASMTRVKATARTLTATARTLVPYLRRSAVADVRAIDRIYSEAIGPFASSGTSIASSAFNLPRGALVEVTVQFASSTGQNATISDTAGNTYTMAARSNTNASHAKFYAWNTEPHSANVVTAAISPGRFDRSMTVAVYTGLDQLADPLIDSDGGTFATSGNPRGLGTVDVPAGTGALITASTYASGTVSVTPTSGWDEIRDPFNTDTTSHFAQDLCNATPGTYSPTVTLSSGTAVTYPVMAAYRAQTFERPLTLATATLIVGAFLQRRAARMRTLSASLTLLASYTRGARAAELVATALNAVGTLSKVPGKVLAASRTLVASRSRSIALTRTASRNASASIARIRVKVRAIAATVATSASLARVRTFAQALAASLVTVASRSLDLGTTPKELAASLTIVASRVNTAAKRLSASLAIVASRRRTVALTRAAARSTSASITRRRGLRRVLDAATTATSASAVATKAFVRELATATLATAASIARVPAKVLRATTAAIGTRVRTIARRMTATRATTARVLRGAIPVTLAAAATATARVLRTQFRTLSATALALAASLAAELRQLPNRLLARIVIRPALGAAHRVRAALTSRRAPEIDPAVGGKPKVSPDE